MLKFNYLARIAVGIFRAFTAPTAKMKIQARPQGATDAVTVAGVGFSAPGKPRILRSTAKAGGLMESDLPLLPPMVFLTS